MGNNCYLRSNFTIDRMKYLLLTLLLISRFSTHAQQLPLTTVTDMARSLTDQQVLTATGRDELIRFAGGQPLKLYEGLDTVALQGITQSVFVADAGLIDRMPGQTRIPPALLDSLAHIDHYPWSGHTEQFAEEQFLQQQFPSRRDLFNFLLLATDFYRFNYTNDLSYNNTLAVLASRIGGWFGPAMIPLFKDTAVEFSVNDQTDTPEAQQERVKTFAPYLNWVAIFQQAGFLPASDHAIQQYYSNGKNIYATTHHSSFLQELGKYITYLDKYPYLREQQLHRLDSLQQTGLIDNTQKIQIITRYKPFTLLSSDDILSCCNHAVPLYTATDIKPYDFIPQNEYGLIPPASIQAVFKTVTDKISRKILSLTATDIRIHKQKPGNNGLYPYQEQLALSRSAKLLSATLLLNNQLYKETIDEKEFESWIRPENFQFLNHYLEDQHDNRRFYFITPNRFTRYEPQPDTVFLALLTEQQATLLQSPYLFDRIEGCYNGSPGDYDYAVYPGDYFQLSSRLSKTQIDSFVAICQQHQVLPAGNTALLQATIREQNPAGYREALSCSPACFDSEDNLYSLLTGTQRALQQMLPRNKLFFAQLPEKRNGTQQPSSGFMFNKQIYRVPASDEAADFPGEIVMKTINKALSDHGLPYLLYQVSDNSEAFNGHSYVLIKPAAAQALRSLSADIFPVTGSSR